MPKNFTYLLIGILMMPIVAFSQEKEEKDNPSKRAEWQRSIIQDPRTGEVPLQELERGRNQVEQYYRAAKKSKNTAAIPNVNWKERGPNNVGGRTRAIMWDPRNGTFTPKKKKVWAGGVAGGLWYNNDITDANSSWVKVNDFWDNIAISWIAHDPGNNLIMYAATGERSQQDNISNTGNTGTGGGGIWKTIDGGESWNRLSSTIPDYVATSLTDGYRWREVYKVIALKNGHVLALTLGGILRSTNGGASWTQLTGTATPTTTQISDEFRVVSDMEMGADSILYVAEGTLTAAPRILKSTDKTLSAFTLCPLPAGSYGLGRVEIALATGTQGAGQVIYAVSAAGSKPDYRFFLKSINGGTSWTAMTPSTYKENAKNEAGQDITDVPFFNGQGDWGLILGTHNNKPDVLYAGGVSFDMSFNGGSSWMNVVKNSSWDVMHDVMHADHHAFAANPDNNDEAIFGNDGGVYYSNSWSSTTTTLAGLGIQARNKDYNVTQYFAVDLHPDANNGLVVGGTQDNGTHAISSAYNTVGSGLSLYGGDGAHTFISKSDAKIVISSYIHITPNLHKNGATADRIAMTPHFSNKGKFINPADYDNLGNTYYANFTYDAKAAVTTTTTDTLAIRYKITTSTVPADNGYTYTHSFLTYSLDANQIPLRVSFLKLGRAINATSDRVIYVGTSDGDVYKTSAFGVDGNQSVTFTKIMDKATTGTGNVSCIDFGADENTIIVTKSNYNIKSVFYATNANAGTGTTWVSKDEATHGLPNIPIRYALINPNDTKQVLLATDLGVWSTTDITAANPDWKETNEALARVRCDMLKYRASDKTLIVGTHGRGIFSVSLATTPCTPPTLAMAGSNSPVTVGSPINLTSSSTGGTSQQWTGPGGYTSANQNPIIASATVANAGVYTVTITSSGTCTATATTNVVVNAIISTCTPPTLATASSNSPVPVTTPLNLTSSATGGASYTWAGPNGFTSALQNPRVNTSAVTMTGVYTVTIASASGSACTATATTAVCIAPRVISGPLLFQSGCEGGAITLTTRFNGADPDLNYQWKRGTTNVGTNSPILTLTNLTATDVGSYSVTGTNSCGSASYGTIALTIFPSPTLAMAGSNSPVAVGAALNLTSSATLGTSYAWAGPNGFTAAVQNPTVSTAATAAMSGVYKVTIGERYTVAIGNGAFCTATATTMVTVGASIVYVNIANTNTTQDGNSWATAYSNLQTALASAPANSDFWVAKGVYKPTTTANRNISFNIPSGAKLYGGFAGTETMISQGNVEGNPTILSGEIGSPSTVNDNSYHVVTFIGVNNSTVLDGFTIMGGNASFNSTRPPSSSSSTTLQPLSIFDGGGIGLDNGSSPTIINCKVISNDAVQGGGLYTTNNSNPTVKNSVFMNNQATFGGGIYNLSSSPTYSNILIAGNKATGGAMYNNSSNPTVTNVTIAGNGGYNGAIFNSNSAPVVKNSILWGNISPFNDTQSVTSYSIVEGGYVGIGNLNVDPQFINSVPSGLSPSLSGDYKLTNTSPAIDAGDNGVIGMTDTELGNFPRRFNNGIVDVGAYEFQGSRMGGTVISIVSGNWETGTTWNIGRKPLAGDTVIIDNNHIITVNNDGVMKNIEIRPNATLLYKTSGIKLQSGF